jgi:L-threonylcarbamoyladenylate synthase
MEILKPSKQSLNKAVEIINKGGVVICPTDTVYGFLVLAENKKAVYKIFKIKKRPKSKTLPIFVCDLNMAKKLAEISKEQEKIIKKYWPGKYTFVLKHKKRANLGNMPKLCKLVVAEDGTVALRILKYKFLNDLLKKINKPLAQTSVNISLELPISKTRDIIRKFGKNLNIDLIIDAGDLKRAKPSKIIDLTSKAKKIIRK